MGSGFKVKINSPDKIASDHGLELDGSANRYLRDTVDRLSNPFIPFESGGLRRLKSYPNGHSIKYTSPDAKYHYHGKLMRAKNGSTWARKGEKKILTNEDMKYHTSGTGPYWDKMMLQRRGPDLIRDLQNFIKRGGK